VMEIVCAAIASSSNSIVTILKAGHKGNTLPGYTVFKEWLAADESLAAQYAKAKEDQADYMGEEMLDIADDGTNDYMERHGKDGENLGWQLNGEHVQRSRLRIEARKWLMGKLRPKKYGDRVEQVHSGSVSVRQALDDINGTSTGLPSRD